MKYKMSWKEDYIKRYGEAAHEKMRAQNRAWYQANRKKSLARNQAWAEANPERIRVLSRIRSAAFRKNHPERAKVRDRVWRDANPEKVKMKSYAKDRKGGKYYEKKLEYNRTGLAGERNRVRAKHGRLWGPYKRIIAPDSVQHHQWRPGTAKYDGVALVEKDQHQYGIIDVIQILEGKITLLTEEEVRNGY